MSVSGPWIIHPSMSGKGPKVTSGSPRTSARRGRLELHPDDGAARPDIGPDLFDDRSAHLRGEPRHLVSGLVESLAGRLELRVEIDIAPLTDGRQRRRRRRLGCGPRG